MAWLVSAGGWDRANLGSGPVGLVKTLLRSNSRQTTTKRCPLTSDLPRNRRTTAVLGARELVSLKGRGSLEFDSLPPAPGFVTQAYVDKRVSRSEAYVANGDTLSTCPAVRDSRCAVGGFRAVLDLKGNFYAIQRVPMASFQTPSTAGSSSRHDFNIKGLAVTNNLEPGDVASSNANAASRNSKQ